MQLAYLLLFFVGLLLVVAALKMPGSFLTNEKRRKLFRKIKRQEEKDNLLKP